MRRTRFVRLGAVVAAATLVAAACGDDDDGGDGSDTTGAETEETDAEAESTDTESDTTGDTEPGTDDTAAETEDTAEEGGDEEATDGTVGDIEGESVQDPDVLNLAYLLPQSGDLAAISSGLIEPLNMGIEEIHEVGDTEINLFGTDSGTDPAIAVPAADSLLGNNPDALIGAAASGVSLSVIDRITGEGVVQCSGSNTAAEFTDYDDDGFYFRTAPSDNLQGPALTDVILGDGYLDVAILYRNDEYGAGFANSVTEAVEEGGGEVVAEVAYDFNATTFDGEAQELAAADPEAIAMISFEEGSTVLQAAIGQGIGPQDIPWYVADGFRDGVTAADVDPDDPGAISGIRGTAPAAAPETGEATFPDRFQEFAGDDIPTIFSAQKYDCLITIVLASEIADSTDPADIADNMNDVTRDGEKCETYEECHQLILDGEDIDYDGASGALDFTEQGEPSVGTYDVYTYNDEGEDEVDEQIEMTEEG